MSLWIVVKADIGVLFHLSLGKIHLTDLDFKIYFNQKWVLRQ
jgi:hypothetical protein